MRYCKHGQSYLFCIGAESLGIAAEKTKKVGRQKKKGFSSRLAYEGS